MVSTKEIVHTINNQLAVVMGKAALLASETEDQGTRKRCQEIERAAREISALLNREMSSLLNRARRAD